MCTRDKRWLFALSIVVGLLLVSLACGVACAQGDGQDSLVDQTLPQDAFQNGTLSAQLSSRTSYSFIDPTSSQNLTFAVKNPTNASMSLYLAVFRHGQWNVVDTIGTLGPGETKTIEYPVEFRYTGMTDETDRFSVIGRTGAGYVGKEFFIREDWSQYEKSLKSTLSVVGLVSAGALLGILVIVLAGVLAMALGAKYGEDGEYTLRTLFFPIAKARPLAEKIANVTINPAFWTVELALGSLLVALILLMALTDIRPDIGILVFLIGGVAAIFMPIIFLVLGWMADYYDREPFRFIVAMFMWGVMATFIAFFMNTMLSMVVELLLGSALAWLVTAVVIAPVVEEVAKGLGVLIISGHHELDNTFDGILFGFAIGMGFAAVENWLYFASNASPVAVGGLVPWVYLILYRSFLGSLAHGCFTAATGGAIGFFKARGGLRSFAFAGFFVGLPVAIVLHGLFNFTAIVDAIMQSVLGVPVPVFDPLLTITATVVYIIIGILLQLRMRERLTRQGPKPEG